MKNEIRKNKKRNNRGFSLVELIIVIAIMAVLTAIVAPQYIKYVEKSKVSADEANITEFDSALKVIAVDTDTPLPVDKYTVVLSKSADVAVTVTSATAANVTLLKTDLSEYLGSTYASTRLDSKTYAAGYTFTVDVTDTNATVTGTK